MYRMQGRGLLIFSALQMEADAIAGELGLKFDRSRSVAIGLLGGATPVKLYVIGIRAVSMAPAIPSVVDGARPAGVILAGLAGALDPSLQLGDVIVDGLAMASGAGLPPPIRRGRIHTADSVVASASAKAALFKQTGALAVDMESAPVRGLISSSGVPLIIVRAISDTADQSIDPTVLQLVDTAGRPNTSAIIKRLIRDPVTLPRLLTLRSQSRLAIRSLARQLAWLLTSQPIGPLFEATAQFPSVD